MTATNVRSRHPSQPPPQAAGPDPLTGPAQGSGPVLGVVGDFMRADGSPGRTPRRIQLRRTKGWRKPDGAIVVARPSRWGNPIRITKCNRVECGHEVTRWCVFLGNSEHQWHEQSRADAQRYAVEMFASLLAEQRGSLTSGAWRRDMSELRGHDLACWCPLDQPCHADILLEIANA